MKIFTVAFVHLLLVFGARSAVVAPNSSQEVLSFITNGENETASVPFYGYLEIFHNNVVSFGGSALISRTAVVTVAQNVVGFSAWRIGFGANRISELIWSSVAEAIIHPHYEASTLINNIAVLVLSQPIIPSSTIAPLTIPPAGVNFPLSTTTGSVVGFGWNQYNAQPDILQTTTFRVWPQNQCGEFYPHLVSTNHLQNYFCAADPNEISNICPGDQGGGMFSRPLNVLFGIASFIRADDCNSPESRPAAFIRLSEYFLWLLPHLD